MVVRLRKVSVKRELIVNALTWKGWLKNAPQNEKVLSGKYMPWKWIQECSGGEEVGG